MKQYERHNEQIISREVINEPPNNWDFWDYYEEDCWCDCDCRACKSNRNYEDYLSDYDKITHRRRVLDDILYENEQFVSLKKIIF